MIESDVLSGLPAENLISLLPGLDKLVFETGKVVKYKKGAIVCESGEILDRLIIPINNDLVLSRKNEGNTDEVFGFLQRGRSLALSNLLSDKKVNYQAATEIKTNVLEVPKKAFIDFLNQHEEFKTYLQFISKHSGLRALKDYLKEFNIDTSKIINMVNSFELVQVQKLSQLNAYLNECLVLVNRGRVLIESTQSGHQEWVGEGCFLGTEALISPSRVSFKFVKTQNAQLGIIPLEVITTYISDHIILENLYREPFISQNLQYDDRYLKHIPEDIGEEYFATKLFQLKYPGIESSKLVKAEYSHESLSASCVNMAILLAEDFNYSMIESYFKKDLTHVSSLKIGKALEMMGLTSRSFQGKIDNGTCPLLCFINDHLVLIYAYNRKWVYFIDPIHGNRRGKKELFDNLDFIEGTSYLKPFKKNKLDETLLKYQVQKAKSTSSIFAWDIIKKRKALLYKVIGLSALIFLIGLISPYLSGKVVDEVIALKDLTSLYSYGTGLLLCYLSVTLLEFFKGRLLTDFSYFFDFEFTQLFYQKLLDLRQKYFNDTKVGDVFARLDELAHVRRFFSTTTLGVLLSFVTSIIFCLILIAYSVDVLLVVLGMFAIIFIIQYFFKKKIRKIHLKLFETDAKTNSLISETISSMITIKSSKAEKKFSQDYDHWFLKSTKLQKELALSQSSFDAVLSLFTKGIPIIVIWVAVLKSFEGELSLGEIFSINLYVAKILGPLNQIVSFFMDLEELNISYQKLDEVMDQKSEEKLEDKITGLAKPLKGLIRLDRVHFRYEEDGGWILNNINLSIYPKQTIALVGASGCGKTTLANLIAGNLKPTQGKIYFDGIDQSYLSLNAMREQIGFIQQNNRLFAGSIESNITYGFDHTDINKLDHVSDLAYCSEFINIFPTGYKQFLAEGGMGLSGGQKQRLSIARTLYAGPKILILDEATSALDSDSEYKIIQTLKTVLKSKTSIIIAHRYSTIRNCDYIFVMEKGEIIEAGTHSELLNIEGGKFFELFKDQIIN